MKRVLKSNVFILTFIDLIGVLFYMSIMKFLSYKSVVFDLYDLTLIILFTILCFSKNRFHITLKVIDNILEKDKDNEKNNIR